MQLFNRSTEIAIAAMSRLAEAYPSGESLTASQIAGSRNISKHYVAKVLVALSQRGLVQGSPGRRGGYALARPPEEIYLIDIATEFSRLDRPTPCPFGPGNCGVEDPCPVHDQMLALKQALRRFLDETNLEVFTREEAGA